MADVISVATYLLKSNPQIGRVQLQKLLYLSQGWSLAWRGQPLFDDDIQAWKLGPVVPTAYEWHCDQSAIDDVSPLDTDQQAIVDAIVATYGHLSGDELIALAHDDEAWQDARIGCDPDDPCDRIIDPSDLMRSFAKQSMQGQGPARPALTSRTVTPERLEEASDRIAQDWATALKLLAE